MRVFGNGDGVGNFGMGMFFMGMELGWQSMCGDRVGTGKILWGLVHWVEIGQISTTVSVYIGIYSWPPLLLPS